MSRVKRILFLCSGNYYRSRFAEELFNHLAEQRGLPYRADSAGLWPECHTHNPGPMSPHTLAALNERGVHLPTELRSPRDVERADVADSVLTIAVKDAEHRPLITQLFPDLIDRVEFWHVHDVADAPPTTALPQLEQHVRELIERLAQMP